jgi:hypothetical protein
MPPDNIIDLTVDPKGLLPQAIVDNWLPDEDWSILSLFCDFNKYPPNPSHYTLPANLQPMLHSSSIQGFDYESLLKIPPPAIPSISKAYQDAIKRSKYPILSVTLQPQFGDPITLPTWIFDYWVEIGRALDIRRQWKTALTWVQKHSTSLPVEELCRDLLRGLSFFSWSRRAAYSGDILPLLSNSGLESYLNSFHIDHMIGQTRANFEREHGPNNSNHHIFATVDQLSAIIRFYSAVHAEKGGFLWDNLMVIENKIITGEVNSLGGIIHLPAHWVSVVIDFRQLQILYGDSLRDAIPGRIHQAFKRWIEHLVTRSTKLPANIKTTLTQLPIGHQKDNNACGLFALNAIDHHYLKSPLLPSDSIALVGCRIGIALSIISTMTVCVFILYKII